jgi:nitroreductase
MADSIGIELLGQLLCDKLAMSNNEQSQEVKDIISCCDIHVVHELFKDDLNKFIKIEINVEELKHVAQEKEDSFNQNKVKYALVQEGGTREMLKQLFNVNTREFTAIKHKFNMPVLKKTQAVTEDDKERLVIWWDKHLNQSSENVQIAHKLMALKKYISSSYKEKHQFDYDYSLSATYKALQSHIFETSQAS